MGSNNASWWASVGTFAGVGAASLTFFFFYICIEMPKCSSSLEHLRDLICFKGALTRKYK